MFDKHNGYLQLASTVFIDGLHHALGQLVTYKQFNTDIGIELHWLMSDEYVPRTFRWYCDVFNVDPERIRKVVIQDANDHVHLGKKLPNYKVLRKADCFTKGTDDVGE
jgi:hypothetical protein